MKKVFFIIWCLYDLVGFYLCFILLVQVLNNFNLKSVIDFLYCMSAVVITLVLQIIIIKDYLKKEK